MNSDRLQKAHAVNCVQESGDVIYIPHGWSQ